MRWRDDAATSAVVALLSTVLPAWGMSQEELMMRQEEVLRLDELERAASANGGTGTMG